MLVTLKEILNEEIRALYWKQPYLSLMLKGKVETRVWDTQYRGWVLMCGSAESYNWKKLKEVAGLTQMARIREATAGEDPYSLKGVAVAIGRLAHSQPMDPGDENDTFVKFDNKLFCHVYENVIQIKPFKPYDKGFVGMWTITDNIRDQIKAI